MAKVKKQSTIVKIKDFWQLQKLMVQGNQNCKGRIMKRCKSPRFTANGSKYRITGKIGGCQRLLKVVKQVNLQWTVLQIEDQLIWVQVIGYWRWQKLNSHNQICFRWIISEKWCISNILYATNVENLRLEVL